MSEVRVPGDKSVSHRALMLAALSPGWTQVIGSSDAEDLRSTLGCLEALGVPLEPDEGALRLGGLPSTWQGTVELDCGNSGTTMRLMSGLLAGREGRFVLDGDSSLRRRPMHRVAEPLAQMGAKIEPREGFAPVVLEGRGAPLLGGCFEPRQASAQVKSLILLAGLRAKDPVEVRLPGPSRDHTERMLKAGGVDIQWEPDGSWARLGSRRSLHLDTIHVPGDLSSALFFLVAAGVTGREVRIEHLGLNPTRTRALKVLESMGLALKFGRDEGGVEPMGLVSVAEKAPLGAVKLDAHTVAECIDEIPILAVAASQAQGETRFCGCGELRHKESDRLQGIVEMLGAAGAVARVEGDDLWVAGEAGKTLPGGAKLRTHGDHRLAMAGAILSLCCRQALEVDDPGSVSVSFPEFWTTLEAWKGAP